MKNKEGREKPGISSLPRMQDRMTFIYLERCKISRDNTTITVKVELLIFRLRQFPFYY